MSYHAVHNALYSDQHLNHYDEDIAKLKEDAKGFSGFYEIGRGRYDLTVILDEFDYGSTWDHS